MSKPRFPQFLILTVLVLITSCDILSTNNELSKTERLLIGNPWNLSTYEVLNGAADDGFGVAEEFHFLKDKKIISQVDGIEIESNWVFKENGHLIIIYQKFPWEENVIELKVDTITNSQLTLSFRNFGYDVIAIFSRD